MAELKANSLLGKRVGGFELAHAHEEDVSSFDIILEPKRTRMEEVASVNNTPMSGPHGEARHEQ